MTEPPSRLPRTLGLPSALALVVGISIGSGIFRTPAVIAQRVPSPMVMLAVWVGAGLVTLCGALCLAELGAALPQTGGYYVFLREGWGRPIAFLFGWTQLTVLRASALGGVAIVCADYALRTFGLDPTAHVALDRSLAAAAIAVAAVVNIAGLKPGAAVVTATTVAKFSALVSIVIVAFVLGGRYGGSWSHLAASSEGPITAGNVGLAFVSVLWAYDGFGDVAISAGEVRSPERTLPRAMVVGTLAVVSIYVLANVAFLYVLPVKAVAQSPLVAADTLTVVVGPAGAALVSLFVAVSAFGTLNGITLTSPRVFFAMAEDGLFFRQLARIHSRNQTPYVAITLAAVLGMALVVSRSFEALTSTFVVAVWPFYALCVGAVYRLRKLRPELSRPYRVPGYPVVPAIFIVAVAWFVTNALITEPVSTGATFALIAAGFPVYYLSFAGRARVL